MTSRSRSMSGRISSMSPLPFSSSQHRSAGPRLQRRRCFIPLLDIGQLGLSEPCWGEKSMNRIAETSWKATVWRSRFSSEFATTRRPRAVYDRSQHPPFRTQPLRSEASEIHSRNIGTDETRLIGHPKRMYRWVPAAAAWPGPKNNTPKARRSVGRLSNCTPSPLQVDWRSATAPIHNGKPPRWSTIDPLKK